MENLGKQLSKELLRAVEEFEGEWLSLESTPNRTQMLVPRFGRFPGKTRLASQPSHRKRVDFLFDVQLNGQVTTFVAEVKATVRPSDLRWLLNALNDTLKAVNAKHARFLVLTGRMTKRTSKKLREQGVSYFDAAGNLCLFGLNFHLQQTAPSAALQLETGVKAPFKLGSPKVGRVVRALLAENPEKGHRVRRLAKEVGIGAGYASTVLRSLSHAGFLRREDNSFLLESAADLLDEWASQPRRFALSVHKFSVPALGPEELEEQVRNVCERKGLRHAFTLWSAVNRMTPSVLNPLVAVYCSEPGELADGLRKAKPVARGENLWVMVPRDEGVYQFLQHVDGFTLVHPVQLYHDLMHAPHRGKGAAEMLREAVIGY